MKIHQIDCFSIHLKYFKILGIWPGENASPYYKFYSRIFLSTLPFLFFIIFTINFYFLPLKIDVYTEEMLFYLTVVTAVCKICGFIYKRDKIEKMFIMLESEIFQPTTSRGLDIVTETKQKTVLFWNVTAVISYTACLGIVLAPMLIHLIFSVKMQYPICHYSFIPEKYESIFLYPAYVYQAINITSIMLYDLNLEGFFVGLMFFAIAQLDILDINLRSITNNKCDKHTVRGDRKDCKAVLELNKCIMHFNEVFRFCKLIQQAFSETLFIQFSLGSGKICACLLRFTMPAPTSFRMFLAMYMTMMIFQIMVLCWFGSRIIEKSEQLAFAVYDSDWTAMSRRFKSNLRIFVERTNRPISITGGKMFMLSLNTFTSIMNTAYSFFTLFRHVQSR